jgi:hypothetical protein
VQLEAVGLFSHSVHPGTGSAWLIHRVGFSHDKHTYHDVQVANAARILFITKSLFVEFKKE